MIKMVPLQEVANIFMGSAPPGHSYNEVGEGIPMIAGAGDYGEFYPHPKKWTTSPSRLAEIGDLIICVRATIGDLNWADREYCLGRGVAGVRPKANKLDINYAAHFISTQKKELAKLGTGSTFLAIRKGDLENFHIPLPPLPEQKRIAAILDKADTIRRKRQEAIKLTEDFLRATFLDMFGDPVTNPNGWRTANFGSAVKEITGGWSAKGEDHPAGNGERGVLKISAVTTGNFIPSENKAVTNIDEKRLKSLVTPQVGDLLFSRANTRELVAATCIVHQDEPSLFLPDKLWKIEPDREKATAVYLKFLLTHEGFRRNLTKQATGTSGSMLNISKQKLKAFSIPLPPVEKQKEFSSIFSKMLVMKEKLTNSELDNSLLFSSLTQNAFSGKL